MRWLEGGEEGRGEEGRIRVSVSRIEGCLSVLGTAHCRPRD